MMPQSLYGCLTGKAWFGHGPSSIFFEVVRSALRGLPTTLAVSSGYERVLAPLLFVLPFGKAVGGALAGSLIPPCLAIETIKDHFDCLFS